MKEAWLYKDREEDDWIIVFNYPKYYYNFIKHIIYMEIE